MSKVSVVIPVYNVAPYIEKCVRSVFEQTLDDMEIIFVNDYTTDDSIDIIKEVLAEYPARRSQTRFINMMLNCGKAVARKVGAKCATGDYLIYCDGDDWVDSELYESMYNKAEAESADVVLCDYIDEYAMRSVRHTFSDVASSPHDYLKIWYRKPIDLSCRNKMVKRSIYLDHDIMPWSELNEVEDNGMMSRVFYYAKKMAHSAGGMYHHNCLQCHCKSSESAERYRRRMMGKAEVLTRFFSTKADGKDFAKTISAFQFLSKLNLITNKFGSLKFYRQAFPGVEKIASEINSKAVPRHEKIRFYCVKYHLTGLFIILYKIMGLRYR